MDLRPDLRAAQQSVTAANSQHALARANAKQDFTLSATYSHVNGLSASNIAVSVPLPIFDRNQGEIARTHYAISQAQHRQLAARGQVITGVKDAYEGLETNDRMLQRYRSGYLDVAQKNRDTANTLTGVAPQACSISSTPSAVTALPSSLTARHWRPT